MHKPEQRLSVRTCGNLRDRGIYAERVENLVGSGTPDVLVAAGAGIVTWIEHKVVEWPVKETTRVQFLHAPTPDQCNWHRMWHQQGCRSIFLISNGFGATAKIFVVPGKHADEVGNMTRAKLTLWETNYNYVAKILKADARKSVVATLFFGGSAT